ncbi:UPF0573 protein C2orf70 homolog [Grammomys surdaster]|uniref:UPF0573 protein C2orf70 homolog n=1 Tax=Grammomys surdaster TaxID=491861 RepID=UPI0010A0B954|nr:UPF0573 protein C2orf70 homolog [Grammomys surdaster]
MAFRSAGTLMTEFNAAFVPPALMPGASPGVPAALSHNSFTLEASEATVQQQRKYYQDKTGTVSRVPYFVLPVKEPDRYPLPTDLPPLSEKSKWNLLRVSPDYVRTCQTFPSGKRVSSQERQRRDFYFEFRA